MLEYNSTRLEVNKARFEQARDAIDLRYSILDFMHDKGISITSDHPIKCPFHDDSTPSFFVSAHRNVWKCFGCPDGGKFLSFYKRYMDKYEGNTRNIYQLIDMLLGEDSELKTALGFSTIFVSYEQHFDAFTKEFKDDAIPPRELPAKINIKTMKHVFEKMLLADTKTKLEFIADCERGTTEELLISKYFYGIDLAKNFKLATEDEQDIAKELMVALMIE